MENDTKEAGGNKAKQWAVFTLFLHRNGQWAKKIRQKMHYFGKDKEAALNKWLDERDDLLAGRKPRGQRTGLIVGDLANKYLNAKRHLADTREITERTFRDAHTACERAVTCFGKNRLVDDLLPEDFAKLRESLAKTLGPVALSVEIQRIRSVFKYAFDNSLIAAPVRYGQSFDKPSAKVIRADRKASGLKLFTAEECKHILASADPQLNAMFLLALNGGMGNHDVSSLPLAAVDLKTGWVDFARIKTAVERRFPLWPETVLAIKAAILARPTPKDPAAEPLVFVTRFGAPWVRLRESKDPEKPGAWIDGIGLQFGKLLRTIGLKRPGLSFYAARHTFQTEAENGCHDKAAISSVMGHSAGGNDMSARYRERIDDARLQAVTNAVRTWLFGKTGKK